MVTTVWGVGNAAQSQVSPRDLRLELVSLHLLTSSRPHPASTTPWAPLSPHHLTAPQASPRAALGNSVCMVPS